MFLDPITVPIGANVNSDQVSVTLPDDAPAHSGWPPGNWSLALRVQRPGETELRTTNGLPMMLAPTLDLVTSSASRDGGTGVVTIELEFTPDVRSSQDVRLMAGGHEALPVDLSSQTGNLDFAYPELTAGNQWLRLRVDGVDSLLVNRSRTPPEFNATQNMVIPA